MKNMLILTGPQGSGNHLFSKVFALHSEVYGWKTLLDIYWEGHHHEPFNYCWNDCSNLSNFDWDQSDYYVTSISCPYIKDKRKVVPNYREFIKQVSKYCNVSIAIIGRDQTILKKQQTRVRDEMTTDYWKEHSSWLMDTYPVHFLSQELLYLYKDKYLRSVSRELNWPIAFWDERLTKILETDSNEKYIKYVDSHWLDNSVIKAIKES